MSLIQIVSGQRWVDLDVRGGEAPSSRFTHLLANVVTMGFDQRLAGVCRDAIKEETRFPEGSFSCVFVMHFPMLEGTE